MTIDVEHYRELCSLPGRFQGEGPETPYFYDRRNEGESMLSEDEFPQAELFRTEVEERKAFDIGPWLLFWRDGQGSAYSQDFNSRKKAEAFWEELTS